MTGRTEVLGDVKGVLDAQGRLIDADPPLARLHRKAGGREGGMLALPHVASLARLANRLGTTVSRGAIAADGDRDLELWVTAEPSGGTVALSIGGWTEVPSSSPGHGSPVAVEQDFARAAADWIWETDESLRFTMISSAAAKDLGEQLLSLRGQQLTSAFHFVENADGSLPILNAAVERCSFDKQLADLRVGDGERYRLSGVPLIDGAGIFAGFRGAAVSASAVEADPFVDDHAPVDQEPSIFSERLEKALRDPLDHILSHAENISAQADGPLQEQYAGYAADIASAGRHLLSLVDDLLDLQAIEGPGFKPAREEVDLVAVAQQAVSLIAVRPHERSMSIVTPPEDMNALVRGEERRIRQIIVNLIANAMRYTPEGGVVTVEASIGEGTASIGVSDHGKGIDPSDQARIFEKFERVDPLEPGGTGLGLYTARRLARAMGGDLTVQSELGVGSRFTLTLPAAEHQTY